MASSSSSKAEFIVGGKYKLVRKIGSGSFGDIYLAINITNGEVISRFGGDVNSGLLFTPTPLSAPKPLPTARTHARTGESGASQFSWLSSLPHYFPKKEKPKGWVNSEVSHLVQSAFIVI